MSRKYHLLRKFGITEEQYADLYNAQNGCCAVCHRHANGFRFRLAVDHDHETSEIRGLLCTHCNRYVVGRYRRGNNGISLLRDAAAYLEREYTGWIVPPKPKKKKKCHRKKSKKAT